MLRQEMKLWEEEEEWTLFFKAADLWDLGLYA